MRMRSSLSHPRLSLIAVGAAAAGFITPAAASAQTRYEYDALGRLITVERGAADKTVSYVYDAAGNRMSVSQTTAQPTAFSVNDVSISEGGVLSFVVSRTGAATQAYSVSYATANGSAVVGDYTARSGTLNFSPQETSKVVTVQTIQDGFYENAETLLLNLSSPTGGAVIADGQGVGTINNDDPAPSFAINNVTREEGQNLTFTVTKSGATALTHNVSYATQNNTAAAGSDYVARSGMLSFTPSQTSRTITITGIEDSAFEPAETFRVNLSAATGGAAIAGGQGVGTITDDDNTPPVARTDAVNMTVLHAQFINPLANDSDADGHTLTLTNYTTSSGVNASWNAASRQMRIFPGIVGPAWIDYTISDGNGGTDTARIHVNIQPNNSCGSGNCPPPPPGGF